MLDLEMTKMMELVGNGLKTVIINMHKDLKEQKQEVFFNGISLAENIISVMENLLDGFNNRLDIEEDNTLELENMETIQTKAQRKKILKNKKKEPQLSGGQYQIV